MMNPAPWLQMTNMISYQGLVRTFPSDIQEEIVQQVESWLVSLDAQKNSINSVIERLREYRSALITNAVTGKIDVRGFQVPLSVKELL
ncbi:hypothetical protein OB952_22100 [Aeromonas salmonicida]|uniref:hypothetical protein n=1 Tax=Aeromonas salmonicida TaxID=645 RepID=UPI00259E6450|nr:hypothetical protein [Aeromonas salmonicida]MDM5070025.1 hypothetical protein [Aeromonas salmonicida]